MSTTWTITLDDASGHYYVELRAPCEHCGERRHRIKGWMAGGPIGMCYPKITLDAEAIEASRENGNAFETLAAPRTRLATPRTVDEAALTTQRESLPEPDDFDEDAAPRRKR